MSDQVSEISEKRLDILHHLKTHEGEILQVKKLANLRVEGEASNSDIEATRRLVKRMDEDGLVNYEGSYSGSKVSLTSTGLEEYQNSPYPQGNVGADVGGSGLKRLHGFVVECRIMSNAPDDWLGAMQEKEELTVLDDRENQTILAKDIWVIRLHKDSFTLQLREGCSISSNNSASVFRKAHAQAQSVGAWLEGAADVRVQLKRFKITNAELGFEGHPLAELAGDLPGVPLDRFSVMDEDLQKEALGIDGSPAEHEELEPKSERTESIAQTIENEMQQYVKRPEAIEKRHNLENEMMVQNISGQEVVHGARQGLQVKEQMQETITEVKQVREDVSEMKSVIQDNKKTREALHEQVRATNQLAQRNQELIENKVVQEEQESSSSYDDPVQEIFMETWEDPEYNRPFFRDAADGGEHLCAFKSDGSDFEIILRSETIERLR